MNDRDQDTSEQDKIDFLRGRAPDGLAQRIQQAAADDPVIAADLALERALLNIGKARDPEWDLPDELGWKRLEAAIRKDTVQTTRQRSARLWQAAALVLALITLGQGVLLWSRGDTSRYQTATHGDPGLELGVLFASDAVLGDINTILQQVNGRITDGPGASGFYRVSFDSLDAMTAGESVLSATSLVQLVARE